MTKTDRQLLALQAAARRQPDPVKRGKIADKIKQVRERAQWNKFLGQ